MEEQTGVHGQSKTSKTREEAGARRQRQQQQGRKWKWFM